MVTFEERFEKVKKIKDDLERTNANFDLLHDITKLQDRIQLSTPALNESIAISNSLINHANALILEASKWKGDIRPQVMYGYTREKVGSIVDDWNAMVQDYNITHGTSINKLELREIKPEYHLTEEDIKLNKKMIFKGLELDKKRKLIRKLEEEVF